MSIDRRLRTLERSEQYRMIANVAREHGLTVQQLLAEADAFFALPLAAQLAEVHRLEAEMRAEGLSTEGMDEARATLIKYYREV